MDSKDYIANAVATESDEWGKIERRLMAVSTIRALHAALGIVTEAGEFADVIKKHIFYGKPIDYINLDEELGDLFWYIAIACDNSGVDFEEIMRKNIAKLKKRYPDRFDENGAINRDLDAEREALEDGGHNSER